MHKSSHLLFTHGQVFKQDYACSATVNGHWYNKCRVFMHWRKKGINTNTSASCEFQRRQFYNSCKIRNFAI